MGRKINIYCDIDGVLTYFQKNDSLEKVAMPGYSKTLKEQKNMVEALKKLNSDTRFSVAILGAVLHDTAAEDKKEWLEEKGLGDIRRIFVPYGKSKRDYIEPTSTLNFLIDDFTENLVDWQDFSNEEKRFVGIKFCNDINGTKGRWSERGGICIDYRMNPDTIYTIISGISAEIARVSL